MKITVNGKETETKADTLAGLAQEMNLPERGVAMAVDMNMVQRDAWASTPLAEGTKVLVIRAACGG